MLLEVKKRGVRKQPIDAEARGKSTTGDRGLWVREEGGSEG